jgi:uncharacterized protein YukE
MGSSKKKATEAISELRNWLRRDSHGTVLLQSVERFVGELRQERSALNEHIKTLEAEAGRKTEEQLRLSANIAELDQKVQRLESAIARMQSEIASGVAEIERLQAALERKHTDQFKDAPPTTDENSRFVERVCKRIARQVKHAPRYRLAYVKELGDVMVFDTEEFLRELTDEEMTLIGMFVVTLAAGSKGAVAFSSGWAKEGLTANRESVAFAKWFVKQGWVAPARPEEDIIYRATSELDKKSRESHAWW